MELYNGRPEDTSGRKEKEIKVYDILDSLHIPYIRADHEAVMTMEACEEIDKALGMEICKNLFLCNRKKTSYYLLLMPGNKALKTKELSQQIPTTRLSFASGEDMETYLNVTPGSATVMGLIFDPENKVQLLDMLNPKTQGGSTFGTEQKRTAVVGAGAAGYSGICFADGLVALPAADFHRILLLGYSGPHGGACHGQHRLFAGHNFAAVCIWYRR